MSSTTERSARLEARITPELHALVKRAAEAEGRTVSDFVIAAVKAAAQRTIESPEIVDLSREDQKHFVNALISPSPIAPALERAFERRRELLGVL